MAYQVPPSKASIRQNRFEFNVPGNKKLFSVPLMKYLPIEVIEATQAVQGSLNLALMIFQDDATRAAIKTLDAEQLEDLLGAWREASGITEGESSAS